MSAKDASAPSATARNVERQLVAFSMHGEDYALPITCAREIIRRIIVVEANGTAVGLIVDTVDEVLIIPADQIEAIPFSRMRSVRRSPSSMIG